LIIIRVSACSLQTPEVAEQADEKLKLAFYKDRGCSDFPRVGA